MSFAQLAMPSDKSICSDDNNTRNALWSTKVEKQLTLSPERERVFRCQPAVAIHPTLLITVLDKNAGRERKEVRICLRETRKHVYARARALRLHMHDTCRRATTHSTLRRFPLKKGEEQNARQQSD